MEVEIYINPDEDGQHNSRTIKVKSKIKKMTSAAQRQVAHRLFYGERIRKRIPDDNNNNSAATRTRKSEDELRKLCDRLSCGRPKYTTLKDNETSDNKKRPWVVGDDTCPFELKYLSVQDPNLKMFWSRKKVIRSIKEKEPKERSSSKPIRIPQLGELQSNESLLPFLSQKSSSGGFQRGESSSSVMHIPLLSQSHSTCESNFTSNRNSQSTLFNNNSFYPQQQDFPRHTSTSSTETFHSSIY